jgi:hypothetical protein
MTPVEATVLTTVITAALSGIGGGIVLRGKSSQRNEASGGSIIANGQGQVHIGPDPYRQLSQYAEDKIALGLELQKYRKRYSYLALLLIIIMITLPLGLLVYIGMNRYEKNEANASTGPQPQNGASASASGSTRLDYAQALGAKNCAVDKRQRTDQYVKISYKAENCDIDVQLLNKRITVGLFVGTYNSFSDRYRRQPDYLQSLVPPPGLQGKPLNISVKGGAWRWRYDDSSQGSFYEYTQTADNGALYGKIWLMDDGGVVAAVIYASWSDDLSNSFAPLENLLTAHNFFLSKS